MRLIPNYIHASIIGFESPAMEYVESSLSLDSLLIEHPHATYIGIAKGESMIGDGIFDGDLLVVSRAEKSADNSIIVATLNGEFVCKRLLKKQRLLVSSNVTMPPYQLTEEDDFCVEGVVIRSIRMHKALGILQ
ncbi:LexA family protein [Alteromonas sp. ASW11-130]|uniref:LexA family protein n=1 Tax=Alteromonas sp. ASW11-130 TaxID=3015775 RepID=UPI0022423084|nr:translesion error-prone DNA polymerase V autoproteolytic subunit [Alteromonas sp. ASW11-130]MCW8092972.1 translesion error-prone DNA polymerase V autoproteolytic subunit [Alteromonas sp. ASW11-130]